jgi:hypothetical protein
MRHRTYKRLLAALRQAEAKASAQKAKSKRPATAAHA